VSTQREQARRALQALRSVVPVVESQAALLTGALEDASPSFAEWDGSLSADEYRALTDIEDAVRALGKVIDRYVRDFPK